MGSPGVEVPVFEVPPSPDYIPGPEGPPSPDYVPGPEEPEQAPPSPIYIPFVPEPVYPKFLPVDDEVFPAEEQPLLNSLPTPPPSPSLRHTLITTPQIPLHHYLNQPPNHPLALHMLRDLWDPELLGLDREMHYLFMRLRFLRCGYRFIRGCVVLLPGLDASHRESSTASAARQFNLPQLNADLYGFTDN
ncbi:hypothetical protein Tco_0797375 [Tanacetum coccineum]